MGGVGGLKQVALRPPGLYRYIPQDREATGFLKFLILK